LEVEKGEFICIIGEVGSGKSSLINSLLGDLIYVDNETAQEMGDKILNDDTKAKLVERSKQEGVVQISGSVSYVQQVPWIQNKTLRDNILFGSEMDESKYNHTIEICQLARDFEVLDGGDLTEIGEKGINLSGGQKARVSLARAIYQDRDVILMDDPISALDANVKKHVFEEVFLDELKDKTRILVTHAVDFLEDVDRIVIMDKGEIKYIGTYDELKDNEVIQHIIETLKQVSIHDQEEEVKELKEIELIRKSSSELSLNK
jgi:ATP-binding cassette subfamily C (CFTR/MRP) protein 1